MATSLNAQLNARVAASEALVAELQERVDSTQIRFHLDSIDLTTRQFKDMTGVERFQFDTLFELSNFDGMHDFMRRDETYKWAAAAAADSNVDSDGDVAMVGEDLLSPQRVNVCILSRKDEMFLMLFILRTGITSTAAAGLWKVSHQTISRIFVMWLLHLHLVFKVFFPPLTKEMLRAACWTSASVKKASGYDSMS